MTISTLDQLVTALPGQHRHLYKAAQTAEGAGTWQSLWKAAGQPGAGANPPLFSAGAGYVPTDATVGAVPFTNPSGGGQNTHLGRMAAVASAVGLIILYDRLWACSGLSLNSVAAQNIVTPGALTRPDALGADTELWGEVYTAGGAVGSVLTASYTDQDGNAGNSAVYTHPANALSVGQMVPFALASGDSGVRSVQSLTLSIATGTAGDFGLTILRRVAEIPVPLANVGQTLDAFAVGLPEIHDDACLALMVLCSGASTGEVQGALSLVQG